MTTNEMHELLKVTDQLAQRNSHWLFLFTLTVLAAVVFLAVRWLVSKHDVLMREHRADQQSYTTSLVNINAEFAKVVEKNTSAIHGNTELIERCRDELVRRNA